ncbi:Uncharacterised protein [Klebsiella michiganensis]|uniref:Uncharacterized protein n=1 Tax=Klebsiella michiganensis TaxID=1134687 RepID=A0A7H4N054_9ENTR|nr:Uncharacterised protein [Klebsiella michiganensis]
MMPAARQLFSAIDARFTRSINTQGDKTQQAVDKSLLHFSTDYFVGAAADFGSINLLRLANAADKEVVSGDLLRLNGDARIYRESSAGRNQK